MPTGGPFCTTFLNSKPKPFFSFLFVLLFALSGCAQSDNKTLPAPINGTILTDDGIRLFYREQGKGNDVIVAPVGFYLEPYLMEALAEDRRVIMYDPRNRGRSEAAPLTTVSLDRQIQDLENLRQSLGIEKMSLIGWSGLGMEMAVYAMRYPDHVDNLIQLSPVPPAASIFQAAGDGRENAIDQEALQALDARAEEGEFDSDSGAYCRLYNEITVPSNFANSVFVSQLADVCQYENEHPENLWPYFGALLPSLGNFDWRDDLDKLTMRRLVIHGKEDGVPVSGGEAWVADQPNARILVMSPAGHFPFIEQRAETIDAIKTFLDGQWPEGAESRY